MRSSGANTTDELSRLIAEATTQSNEVLFGAAVRPSVLPRSQQLPQVPQ